MSMNTIGKEETVEIDLSMVPLKPLSKKDVQQLEIALIIGTLYRPEVLELIKDPTEKATWVDSLAVAAAALAREKAGYTIRQIADELGRSETTIRAHLQGKTKAGKLIRETYELMLRGKLRIVAQLNLDKRVKELEERVKLLEEENKRLKAELEKCVSASDIKKMLKELEERLKS